MKIAIIMPLAEQRGGGELMLLHLMQQGREAGVEWLVIFLQNGPMVAQVRELGVTAELINAGRLRDVHRYVTTVQNIIALAQREKVAVILGWMNQGHLYGGLAARMAGIPAIWYQLGIALKPGWNDRMATRLPALGILACSEAGAKAQAQIKPARPLRVVYPGVELERFAPETLPAPAEARRRLSLPASGPLIGIVGRLQRWKGMHVLVEAMPEILRTQPDTHCVVVGGPHAQEPDYLAFLQERICVLGLEERVILTGLQQNIPEWMQAMDVIVHASNHEPFGIVVIEAMALGKPVVAGDAAGPTEIITDGINGLLTPYGDASALAGTVLRFLNSPEQASQMGVEARQRALEFSTQRYARNFIDAVRQLMPASLDGHTL